MPSFEECCRRLFLDKNWAKKVLIGGALSFVPVINLFAFGYLYRFLSRFRRTGELVLPEWEDWGRLFLNGCIFFCVGLVYLGVPLLLGWLVSLLVEGLTWGLWDGFSYFPICLSVFVGPALFISALFEFQHTRRWERLLLFKSIAFRALRAWEYLWVGSLVFVGLQVLGAPLFGFAFFFGFALLIAHFTVIFVAQESGM